MNLTQRFSITHGSIAVLAVAVSLGVMIGGAHHFFWSDIRDSQQAQMKDFTLAVRESHFANEDVATLVFIRQAVKDPAVAFAAFVDRKGRTRVLPASFNGHPVPKEDLTLPDGRRLGILSAPVEAGGKNVGNIVLAYDNGKLEAKVRSQVDRWVAVGTLAGGCAILVAFFMSVLLSRTLVSPLKRIQTGMDQVRAGKLDKLVDVDRSDEIGSLARDFNTMVIQLKELENMKREFIAGVTHDFGTPLHAIRNALEYLEEKSAGPLTPKQAEYLLMISNNMSHLTDFINNLLTTARIEAAKVEPFFEPLDSLAMAREVVELFQPQAEKKGLELRLLNEEPSLTLVTDAVMFRQILTNLVSNGMKFTLKGGVSVKLSKDTENFFIEVADTGIGIEPKYHYTIFDKFFRIRQPKDFPVRQGSGLGLAIAKGLAESMGGTIFVESSPGVGTTFTVKLPRRAS